MICRILALVMVAASCAAPVAAQSGPSPLYRVFLTDGTALTSYGEWARVADQLVFSAPLTPDATTSELHLVTLPVSRVDLSKTERYAAALRAATYAAGRGDADFAKLSDDVAMALNLVATLPTPAERLAAAERARRRLADWPGAHHGYRAAEVREVVGVLDEAIGGLRRAAGLPRFELSLTAVTTEPPHETLLDAPTQQDLVQQLVAASANVQSPAEKVSLLQSVLALLDRAVGALPSAFVSEVRRLASGRIAEERRTDASYERLRTRVLGEGTKLAARADVRNLERLRNRVAEQDAQLGQRRPDDIAGVLATLDAHLDAAHRLRLAQDQWLLRADGLRAYQRAARPFIATLAGSEGKLGDIRDLAGPDPETLRLLDRALARDSRMLALLQPPEALHAVHAVFRSAFELAANAVQLRLDAVRHADVTIAHQAAAAAAGARLLLARAQDDLAAALQPPIPLR